MTQESSRDNIPVKYRLEDMVSCISQRNACRKDALSRFPICIVYGICPKEIQDNLPSELRIQLGSELSCEILYVGESFQVGEALDRAIIKYRENQSEGLILAKSDFLIPIIFMTDQFDGADMEKLLGDVRHKLKQKGYDGDYRFLYYCIYDYENIEAGNAFKEQFLNFLGKGDNAFPLGIFTNDKYAPESQKYGKAIQVIAMHIFLLCSEEDGNMLLAQLEETDHSGYFTLGYWRLDVLKQKLNDCLITVLELQRCPMEELGVARAGVSESINRLLSFSAIEWLEEFLKMPVVSSAELEKILHPGFLKKTKIEYRDLIRLLYGKEDAFKRFLYINLGTGTEREKIDAFLKADIGNYHFVKNHLEETLLKLQSRYEADRSRSQQLMPDRGYIVLDKRISLRELLDQLGERVWKLEADLVQTERKLAFVDGVLDYLHSEEHRQRLEEVERRNREEMALLGVLRREIAWDDRISFTDKISISEECITGGNFGWYEDMLEPDTFRKISANMSVVQKSVTVWLQENLSEVLDDFIKKINELKQSDNKLDLFYAAKLDDVSWGTREKEYLYVSTTFEGETRKSLEEKLQMRLVDKELMRRNWQPSTCMELFCMKEIKDLAEIYNID